MKSPSEIAQEVVNLLFSEKPIVERASDEARENRAVQSYRTILTIMIKNIIEDGLKDGSQPQS